MRSPSIDESKSFQAATLLGIPSNNATMLQLSNNDEEKRMENCSTKIAVVIVIILTSSIYRSLAPIALRLIKHSLSPCNDQVSLWEG